MVERDERAVVRSPDQVSAEVDGEEVVLHLESGVYFGLEGVAARVWELLASPRTLAELVDRVTEEYAVEREACERDLRRFVGDLEREGLVERAGGDEGSA